MSYVHKVGAYHQRDKLSVRHASLPDTSSTSDGQIGLLTPCAGSNARRRGEHTKAKHERWQVSNGGQYT